MVFRRRALGVPVALAAVTIAAGCADRRSEPGPVALLPPDPPAPGWTTAEGPVEFRPDTLYEYLNGGAERYVSLGFRSLAHVRYRRGDDPLSCVTLDVYDMGGDLGAFGIYAAARPAGAEKLEWGAEGYRSGTVAAAYRGSFYVHGEADDERPELVSMLERLTAQAADAAPGPRSPPPILDRLPAEHRVADSERWVADDLLGFAFLPGGVAADYQLAGRRAELFFTELGTERRAEEATAALRDRLAGRVEPASDAPGGADEWFSTSGTAFGDGTVIRAGTLVAGVFGELDPAARRRLLDRLVTGG